MLNRSLALAAFTALTPMAAHAQNVPAPVQAQELRQLDGWSVSALSRANGALPSDLWTRSDPAVLAVVFDRLPSVYDSFAMNTLARRVLFSGGDAPRGDGALAVRRRFEALGKMGAADELATMAAGSGSALTDPGVAMFAAQAELARGRRAEACARGRNATTGETPAAFFLQLRAYCAAVTGDRAAADLALELARSQNAADAWVTGAVAAAGGAPGARPPAARYNNSLFTQLSLAGQLRPGPNPLNDSSTLALVALARAENAPHPQRAQAAWTAFRRGALNAQDTRAILAATPAEITSALPAALAALRQIQALPPATPEAAGSVALGTATAIATALRSAANAGEFNALARFFQADIARLSTAPDAAAALLFARASVSTGDVQVAQRLVASARQAGADETALAPLDAALVALTGARGEQGTIAMQRRIDRGAAQPRTAARDVAILSALGAPVDGTVQAFLLTNTPQGGVRADTGAMLALASAVERGAIGEGALLAVVAAGEGGPARLDADSVANLIRALRGLRLDDEARRVAAEAILAGQPG